MRRSLDSWQLGMDGKLNRGEFTSKILKSAPRIRRRFAQLHRIFPVLMILHDSRIDRFDAKSWRARFR